MLRHAPHSACAQTSLLNQVIVHTLNRADTELVPILVKVQHNTALMQLESQFLMQETEQETIQLRLCLTFSQFENLMELLMD